MGNFSNSIEKFESLLKAIKSKGINLNRKIDSVKALYDFKEEKSSYYLTSLKSALDELKTNSLGLNQLVKFDKSNEDNILGINKLIGELGNSNINKLEESINKIALFYSKLNLPREKTIEKPSFKLGYIPEEIKADVVADLKELEKCFINECYRSVVVLCGRLLETALHRKYYEATGQDILEKAPGIGLGNLIAKLKESDINIDPALTNQIHLVNQVRIFSVHKKKEAFYPSKQQTHAMILYTLDTLEKMFSK
ncbi:hypothetical protein J4209_06740 [Candidatus Woesearchaeota archaeon]|nr:hypothetical protein [Candidatus Woesearchaeota archaeon]